MTQRKFSKDYVELLKKCLWSPLHFNERTGERLRTLHGGAMLRIDLKDGNMPIPMNRVYKPYVAAAEAAWILSGTDSIEWLTTQCSIWNKFADNGKVVNAYGPRIGHQIEKVIQQLKDDPTTRRAVINLWHRYNDTNVSKNAPCPTQIVINCMDGDIHMQVFMRSSDVFVGLPYDIMTWSLILNAIARSVMMYPRFLTFFLANPHLYSAHEKHLKIKGTHYYQIPLPKLSVDRILADKDSYVDYFRDTLTKTEPPLPFDPRPEVFE